uniref:Uncharacterized protein n=1 Tax=Oryza meridionalis TaxID=40149 RepID=A0A0E0E8B6_9ORYZ
MSGVHVSLFSLFPLFSPFLISLSLLCKLTARRMVRRAATGGEKGGVLANWDKGKGEGAVPAADGDKAAGGEKGRRAGGGGLPMTAPRPRGARWGQGGRRGEGTARGRRRAADDGAAAAWGVACRHRRLQYGAAARGRRWRRGLIFIGLLPSKSAGEKPCPLQLSSVFPELCM